MNFAFPFTYSNTIKLLHKQEFDYNTYISHFINNLSNKETVTDVKRIGESIGLRYFSLFNIAYPVEISIKHTETLDIKYEIKLQRLIQISIILVLFTAFFSSFNMGGFLWFSFLLLIAFYAVNLLFADVGIRNLIKSAGMHESPDLKDYTDDFSDEQKQWMQDISRCPACGEHLQSFAVNCPECGLRLPHPTIYKPLDINKYKNTNIKPKQNK